MKSTVDFYDKTAADWAAKGYGTEPEIPCMFDFAGQFPPGSRFLDLCCGCGYETRRLCDLGYEAVGLDFSAGSLAFTRMHDVLTPTGKVFLTVREGTGKLPERSLVTIDGEDYDRNFIAHTLSELIEASAGLFTFVEEAGWDGSLWHNYIFRKD